MTTKAPRIHSIDMLKGICMIYMLIDHWRDYASRMGQDILGAHSTLPIQAGLLEYVHTGAFWLRCTVGYFVAPSFVFLAGASCYLWQARRAPEASLFRYLCIRGLMLAIINCLLFFYQPFSAGGAITFHVLWPVGLGMILLGIVARCPKVMLWILSIVCIAGQNFFESLSFATPWIQSIWTFGFINHSFTLPWGAHLHNVWPVMPWFGILLLGYLCGFIFTLGRKNIVIWLQLGGLCLSLFLLFRLTGIYGDASLWQLYESPLQTLGALISLNKYPPSFQFALYGLAMTFFSLALLERTQFTNRMLLLFGSMPLFFYITHLLCIRLTKFLLLNPLETFTLSFRHLIFSVQGVLLATVFFSLALWLLCEIYRKILMAYKTRKQLRTQSACAVKP